MYEVELKVRASHDRVRERLADLGAERVGTVEQVDTYYDAPHREFAETDEALRTRRETAVGGGDDDEDGGAGADSDDVADVDATTKVTYKGPLVDDDSKTREEFETAVADGEEIERVLEALGFAPAATVEKRRTRYRLDGYTVTLDDVAGLGEFVEVEREVPESEVDSATAGARTVLTELGLDPDDGIRTSYLGLLLASDSHE